MTQAILFDFFGTLVEYSPSRTEQGYHNTYALLKSHGVDISYEDFLTAWVAVSAELDTWSQEHVREFSMRDVSERFMARISPALSSIAFCEQLGASYVEEWGKAIVYLPETRAFLVQLASRFQLALVTNTHDPAMVWRHLDKMQVADLFSVVVTSLEYGRPKPYPGIFQSALASLQVGAVQAVFVGDSYTSDYLGACDAGISAYLIDPQCMHDIPAAARLNTVFELEYKLAAF